MNALRSWQERAIPILEGSQKPNQSVMAFTGSGKTRLALEYYIRGRAAGRWDHMLAVKPGHDWLVMSEAVEAYKAAYRKRGPKPKAIK